MKISLRSILAIAIPVFLAAVLGVIMSFQVRQVALSHNDNVTSFYSFANSFDHYKLLRQEWRPRIASTFLAGRFVNLFDVKNSNNLHSEAMKIVFANWTALWFFLCCLIMVLVFKEKSLLFIFAMFAGVLFAYTSGIGVMRVYPWDLPALFVFCCFIALIRNHHEAWLPIFIPLAMLFKETALVMVVALLFWQGVSWRRKLIFAGITLAVGLALKTGIDLWTGNPSPLFTMTYRNTYGLAMQAAYLHTVFRGSDLFSVSLLKANLLNIFSFRLDSPFFIDAGLLVTLLVLPIKKKSIAMLKTVALVFLTGNLLFGVIDEYRIWFEMIPLALYALHLYFFESDTRKTTNLVSG